MYISWLIDLILYSHQRAMAVSEASDYTYGFSYQTFNQNQANKTPDSASTLQNGVNLLTSLLSS